MRVLALLAGAVSCLAIYGCGSVGEPLYPATKIPLRVTDLTAVERGDRLDIQFTVPSRTIEGLTIAQFGDIELRSGPNRKTNFQVNEWASDAQRISVTANAPGVVRASVPASSLVGQDVIVGVRIANARGRYSDWSNLATVSVVRPLATPAGLKAEAAPQGVAITWSAPGESHFRVYRKTADQHEPSLLATSDQASYTDSTTEYGATYDYYVEAFQDKAVSVVAGPAEVTPKDSFPPAVPSGVTASAGVASIELAWIRNTEPDFKEYRVQRSVGDGPFTQVADGLTAPSYSDHDLQSGTHYRYRVVAVDQTGNVSEPSDIVEATAP